MNEEFIVEVEGYEGENGEIIVNNGNFDDPIPRIYCIGVVGGDGVVRLVDWGYRTIAEAQAAWPQARSNVPTAKMNQND